MKKKLNPQAAQVERVMGARVLKLKLYNADLETEITRLELRCHALSGALRDIFAATDEIREADLRRTAACGRGCALLN